MRGTDWLGADPYLLRHAADHAARAGLLDPLVEDVGFLATVDPIHLLSAFSSLKEPRARRLAWLYRRAFEQLYEADPVDRMAILHFMAMKEDPELVPSLEPPIAPKWRCVWADWRTTSQHQRIRAHDGPVNDVGFGVIDGQAVVASGGEDGAVRLWDTHSGRQIGTSMFGHSGAVRAVCMGELDGRTLVVSGGKDGRVMIWDAGSHSLIGSKPEQGPPTPSTVGSVGVSVTTAFIRSAWARARHPLKYLPEGDRSLNGLLVAANANVFDVFHSTASAGFTSWRRSRELPFHRGAVNSVTLGHIDGEPMVVSGGADGWLRFWNPFTGQPATGGVTHETDEEEGIASTLIISALSPWSGKTGITFVSVEELDGLPVIYSAAKAGSMRIWDARTRRLMRSFTGRGQDGTSLAVGKVDGKPVIVCGGNRVINVWKARDARRLPNPVCSTDAMVYSVDIGEVRGIPTIVSGGEDGLVRLWDARSGTAREEPISGHDAPITSLKLGQLDEEPLIAAGARDGILRLFRLEDGKQSTRDSLSWRRGAVNSACFGRVAGHSVVISGASDGAVCIWDSKTGKMEGQLLGTVGTQSSGLTAGVTSLAFAELHGVPVIAAGDEMGTVRLWNASSGELRGGVLEHRESSGGLEVIGMLFGSGLGVGAIAFGEIDDEHVIISGGANGVVRAWNAESHQDWPHKFEHLTGHQVTSLVVRTLSGKPVVVSATTQAVPVLTSMAAVLRPKSSLRLGGEIRVWDFQIGLPIGDAISADSSGFRAVDFSEIGGEPIIVSGGDDGMVRVWNARSADQLMSPLAGHSGPVRSVALAEVGGERVIVSGGEDGTVRLWAGLDGSPRLTIAVGAAVTQVAVTPGGELVAALSRGLAVVALST